MASVALGDICLRFVWQAWRLVTWTFTLCGGRGTYGTGLALVTRLVPCDAAPLWRGRRGTWRHRPSFCVALGDMDLHFVWPAWHLRHWAGSADALGRAWSLVTPRLFGVAGVALGDICLRFVWQAWHLVTRTFTLCGMRGTYGTGLALVTRLVALGPVRRRASFEWQAWHLATSAFVLCGRGGTWRHGPSLVALGGICLTFVWQEWHLRRWAGSGFTHSTCTYNVVDLVGNCVAVPSVALAQLALLVAVFKHGSLPDLFKDANEMMSESPWLFQSLNGDIGDWTSWFVFQGRTGTKLANTTVVTIRGTKTPLDYILDLDLWCSTWMMGGWVEARYEKPTKQKTLSFRRRGQCCNARAGFSRSTMDSTKGARSKYRLHGFEQPTCG
eukprot:s2129_g4.t1